MDRKHYGRWYNKRTPWNLVDDLATYIKYSIRANTLWLEKSCSGVELLYLLAKFDGATNYQYKDKQDADKRQILLCILRKMYFAFDEVSLDFVNSPWNIWFKENNYADRLVPSSVREEQKKYNSVIDETVKLYADLVEFISGSDFYYGYCVTKKVRKQQLRKIDSVLVKVGAFKNDLAWYIYEGLLSFKDAKRCGHPCYLTKELWDEYLDSMIFTFHEIVYCNENFCNYTAEEYKHKYNLGKELFGKYFVNLWD